MDRRLWIITAIAIVVFSTASAFLGIESELLANRIYSVQNATRLPEPLRAEFAAQPSDSLQKTRLAPQEQTVASPDQVALAGF